VRAESPFGRWMTDLRAEATGTWAIGGAVRGLIIGLLGLKFGRHEAKSKIASLAIIAFALLSVEGIVTYLHRVTDDDHAAAAATGESVRETHSLRAERTVQDPGDSGLAL
jgi:hypothetical protein